MDQSQMPRRLSIVLKLENGFDPSDDELNLMNALEEDQSTSKEQKRDNSPARSAELQDRQFQLSDAAKKKLEEFASKDHTVEEDDDDDVVGLATALKMDRDKVVESVRSSGPYEVEENGRLREFDTPSPESIAFMKALENPMAARSSTFGNEFEDLIDTPEANDAGSIPPSSPPAYTSTEEGYKPSPKPAAVSFLPDDNFLQEGKDSVSHNVLGSSSNESSSSEEEEFTANEIEVFSYVDKYKANSAEFVPKLQAFSLEYQPAFGEADLFVKIPRPDEIDDNAGLSFFDEPQPTNQTDAAVVEMQIRNTAKDSTVLDDAVPVKVLSNSDNQKEQIADWIAKMKEHHKQKPPTVVRKDPSMPTVEQLMQETPPQLQGMRAVPAELDVSLEQYVDLNLNLLDIPVNGNRIEGVKMIFATLMELQKSAHFRNFMARQNEADAEAGNADTTERLEL